MKTLNTVPVLLYMWQVMRVFKKKNKWLVSPVTFAAKENLILTKTYEFCWTEKGIASTKYLNSSLETNAKCWYTHNSGPQKIVETLKKR